MLTKSETTGQTMLSDASYQFFKKLVTLILPAVGALYFSLAGIWGLPAADKVVGSIACITTFLGVLLNVSSNRYEASVAEQPEVPMEFDGDLVITETPDGKIKQSLQLEGDPDNFSDKGFIVFRVVKTD